MSDFWLGVIAFALWLVAGTVIALAYHTAKVLYQRRWTRQQARRRP